MAGLALTKAHRGVEGGHRASAWKIVLDHVEPEGRHGVVDAMEEALARWMAYRDEVATLCGLARGTDGRPSLAATGRVRLRVLPLPRA